MAGLTQEATQLIREMLNADGTLPPYNEDVVNRNMLLANDYSVAVASVMRSTRKQQEAADAQAGGGGGGEPEPSGRGAADGGGGGGRVVDWQQHPEAAAAVVIYHELIMKVKRILLTYAKMRADTISSMRWQKRKLATEQSVPREQEFAREYAAALDTYMGFSRDGIGMDLTTELDPPKHACVEVRVMRTVGSVALSHSNRVNLVKGAVHELQCSEAEPLIRKGVLQVLRWE